VARELNAGGVGTLLMDLLTEAEAAGPRERQLVFDIPLLASRLRLASTWLLRSSGLGLPPQLPLGFFGASTGGGAALWAAAGACLSCLLRLCMRIKPPPIVADRSPSDRHLPASKPFTKPCNPLKMPPPPCRHDAGRAGGRRLARRPPRPGAAPPARRLLPHAAHRGRPGHSGDRNEPQGARGAGQRCARRRRRARERGRPRSAPLQRESGLLFIAPIYRTRTPHTPRQASW